MLRYGGLVYLKNGHLQVMPFEELRDPATGRTRVRLVDIRSEHSKVARGYMIRLGPRDLEDPETEAKLERAAKISPEAFRKTFAAALGVIS